MSCCVLDWRRKLEGISGVTRVGDTWGGHWGCHPLVTPLEGMVETGFADSGEKIELVLDYIVERKRMDDLADSIVDGRFREQKVKRNTVLSAAVH